MLYLFINIIMDADIAQKQEYLYKQIIEGGFNPEEFQEYLFYKNP